MANIVVLGAQWGDEGKGKIVDLLAQKADHVVRSQGGNNAGHTLVIKDQEYRLHLLPSGIISPKINCYIAAGTVLDLEVLWEEMQKIEALGISFKGRLFISSKAHVILPYHKWIDRFQEERKGSASVGTTGRGIGPCYGDKVDRVGFRLGQFADEKSAKIQLQDFFKFKKEDFEALQIDIDAWMKACEKIFLVVSKLKSYLADVEILLAEAHQRKEKILFEGAQGFLLDSTFGTYPYVTSSSTTAAGIIMGAGYGGRDYHVLGVMKAYFTRVGNGPFPTMLNSEDSKFFISHEEAREIGTTTGRKRKMGWFDAVLASYSIKVNGIDSLALTKIDVMDPLPKVKICTHYKINGKIVDRPPVLPEEWNQIEPIYEEMPGWQTSTRDCESFEELPDAAKKYLDRIQKICKVPYSIISTGPERERSMILNSLGL